MKLAEGDPVKAGGLLAEWDPFSVPIMTELGGVAQWRDINEVTMSDGGDSEEMEDVGTTPTDFFDHEPSKQEKIEVSALEQ